MLRVAGRFAAPVPLAETLLAGWLLAQAKFIAPAGPMTISIASPFLFSVTTIPPLPERNSISEGS